MIFSHINIYSIQNKFDNFCDLLPKNVVIISVSETKSNSSILNSQFLIPDFHKTMKLDITSKRGKMLIYI